MKLHRFIDHDWQMTPIEFQVTRSKVNVTVTKKRILTMAATTTDSPYGGMHTYVHTETGSRTGETRKHILSLAANYMTSAIGPSTITVKS
ncbi:hypothetical protein DPMN_066363 [Dreissena polymorpha]|uniref:Uncharacterized protein n=1 Tax=Dreissena polymorpha TaxID=45954 RepID=A0A9D3YVB1_DREPO|nr:hypothetical protein DPMN_066363 [Dreissena polymorpha]